jgi:cytochrome c biogenesis protein CcmG, thiol:disulfide interchange protein DsbE
MKNLVFALLLALPTLAFAQKPVPNVNLKTLEGKTFSTQDFAKRGKVTVLNFWATWCAPCKKELDAINSVYADWQKKYNVELIAVTIDDARSLPKVKPLLAQKGWKYTVLSDVNKELIKSLSGSDSVPFSVLLDKNGKVVFTHGTYKAGDEKELEAKIAEYAKK